MTTKTMLRAGVIAVFLALTVFPTLAQAEPLAAPQPARGARANAIPFYLPDRFASSVRGPTFTVTTTTDEDGLTCDESGTGLSLREALTVCAGSDYVTVYVPAGTYTLSATLGEIDFSGTSAMTLIGADPFTTIIESEEAAPRVGSSRLLYFDTSDYPLTLANLTLRNGNAGSDEGGALSVSGYGTVALYNTIFESNKAEFGGAIYFEDDSYPLMVSMDSVTFAANTAGTDGGAIHFNGLADEGHSIFIQNSSFIANAAGTAGSCDYGGGAITVIMDYDYGGSVVIDNSLFDSNMLACVDYYGGAISYFSDDGSSALTITYSSLINNSASGDGSYGGAVYVDNDYGLLNIGYSNFENNSAGYGGAVYDYVSYSANINQSAFFNNTASSEGGAAYFYSGYSGSIQNSLFLGNSAVEYAGAIYAYLETLLISNSQIELNSVGDVDGLGGYGGGIYLSSFDATLLNSLVEDNHGEFGPDCYNGGSDPIASLGGSGVTDTTDCDYVPHPTDQFDNLLLNGGFETAGLNAKTPASWTVKNAAGDKRACNGVKFVSPFGNCAYVFKGGGSSASLAQNVTTLTYADGEELLLFALGDGSGASKVQVQVKATYSDTLLGKTKKKLTFSGGSPVYEPAPGDTASLILTDGDLSKLQVKIVDKSTGGKFYLDRVYLYSTLPLAPRVAGALPPPAAPSGFRGGN